MMPTAHEIARRIDHSLLTPEATPDQIDRVCDEAVEFGFFGVCVNPVHVARAARRVAATGTGAKYQPVVVSVAR